MIKIVQIFHHSACFGRLWQTPANRLGAYNFSGSVVSVNGPSAAAAIHPFSRRFSQEGTIKLATTNIQKDNLNEISDKNKSNDKNEVIYRGELISQVKKVKIFTCTSSLLGLTIQPFIVQNILTSQKLLLNVAFGVVVGFFTFVTPVLIHMLTKKYVTEIKYNSNTNTYTGTTLSFFLRKVNFDFKIEDIEIPQNLTIFTTLIIKGRPVFLVRDSFLVVSHYIRMMGYDKPINLNLNTPANELEGDSLEKQNKDVKS